MSAPNSNNANDASLIGGHAQYAKGYVEETVCYYFPVDGWMEQDEETKGGSD